MNYYRRFVGDYASKTAELSLAEHGAYTILLDVYYSTEKPLPADLDALCRICRAMSKPEQAAVKSIANKYFPIGEDGLRHNSRADSEVGKAQATIEKQRASGIDSAKKRWSTDESTDRSTHESTDAETDRSAIQPPTTKHQPLTANPQPPEKKSAKKSRARPLPVDFSISENVREWAESKGHTALENYLEFFTGRMRASGKEYVDWDAAFMNCIREDWPGIRKANGTPDYSSVGAE